MARGTSVSKSTSGVPDARQSLPQTQRCVYTDQRVDLCNCQRWMGYRVIGELEGEPVKGGLVVKDRVLVFL